MLPAILTSWNCPINAFRFEAIVSYVIIHPVNLKYKHVSANKKRYIK